MLMYTPSYISSRIVLYVSSKSLPIPELLSKSTIPTCERALLSNFVGQGVKLSYLSPPYPLLTRSPFSRVSKHGGMKEGVYTSLPPYDVTVKYALQTLKRTYGNNVGGGSKPLLIITGLSGAPVARLLSSLMSGSFPASAKQVEGTSSLLSLETSVDILLPSDPFESNILTPGTDFDWHGYFNSGVIELGGDSASECEVVTNMRPTSPIAVSVNSTSVNPPNPPSPPNDFLSSACVNALSQSVNLLQSEFDSLDVQALFHPSLPAADRECLEMCEGIWKEWAASRAIQSLVK